MAGMGDPKATDSTDLSKFLCDIEQPDAQHTLDEGHQGRQRDNRLTELVCQENCLVALARGDLLRLLTLTLLRATGSQRAVVLVQSVKEHLFDINHLNILLPNPIHLVLSPTHRNFDGVSLMEPNIFCTLLARRVLFHDQVDVLVLRDFQHYLELYHPYRNIVHHFQHRPGTRLLALVDRLSAATVRDLETALECLRTPAKLTCRLGIRQRPYANANDAAIEAVLLHCNLSLAEILPLSEDALRIRDAFRDRGVLAARNEAKKVVANAGDVPPDDRILEFLAATRHDLVRLKGEALLALHQGHTLALTTTSCRQLTNWLTNASPEVLMRNPEDRVPAGGMVVATYTDLPSLRWHRWDTVVLCDLPHGFRCDDVIREARRRLALCTEPQWKSFQAMLELQDRLEKLVERVNHT